MRAPAKIEAAKHLPIYQLGLGEGCKQRVEFLLKGLRFHFTGSWGGADRNVSTSFLCDLHLSHLRVLLFEPGMAI